MLRARRSVERCEPATLPCRRPDWQNQFKLYASSAAIPEIVVSSCPALFLSAAVNIARAQDCTPLPVAGKPLPLEHLRHSPALNTLAGPFDPFRSPACNPASL